MGLMTAMELADLDVSLEDQIRMHFAANCYPPIPKVMVPVAVAAVNAYWDDDLNMQIPLPEGVTFRDGSETVSARQAIESLRLEAWCFDSEE